MWHARASPHWPTVAGRVVSSGVVEETGSDDHATFGTAIIYEYTVEHTRHSAHRVAFGEGDTPDPTVPQTVAARYDIGKTVTVYYRAADPDNAVLEPGLRWRAGLIPALGFAFCAAGLVILRDLVREKKA